MASLVTSTSLVRVLQARWYIVAAGLTLTLALVVGTFMVLPRSYSSAGTLVLVNSGGHGQNPLTSSTSLDTMTQMLVQTLSAPQTTADLGLSAGEKLSVQNGSLTTAGKVNAVPGPFITIQAQSTSPDRSSSIVVAVSNLATTELASLQNSLKVSKRNTVQAQTVVSPNPGRPVLDLLLRTLGIVGLVGALLTLGATCAVDRMALRRRRRKNRTSVQLENERVLAEKYDNICTHCHPHLNGSPPQNLPGPHVAIGP